MILDKINKAIIKDWIEGQISVLKHNYTSWGAKSSGKYGNSLSYKTTGKTTILKGADYSQYTEYGRRKGKFPNVGAIQEWIRAKHIKPKGNITEKSLAYLIGRKIAQKGVAPSQKRYNKSSNLFESAFNPKTIGELNKELIIAQKQVVKNEIIRMFEIKFKNI